jgi:hypothetical protein
MYGTAMWGSPWALGALGVRSVTVLMGSPWALAVASDFGVAAPLIPTHRLAPVR